MKRKRILFVDDNEDNRIVMETWINFLGHDIVVASGAQEALKMVRLQRFDLILTDINMPGGDGFYLLERMLEYDPTLKVVMISAHDNAEITSRAYKLGAFDYLTQPIEFDKLEKILNKILLTNKVFIVHGHDEAAKELVARFISKLKLQPIILQEQPTAGRTIIEKFEYYANVGFAVVLLTPDDTESFGKRQAGIKARARQNVIFELGYFVGFLGRDKVCALYKEGVELPSDYHGVIYLPMDAGGTWRMALAREIQQSGMAVDLRNIV